jgi:hypothetical protein
LFLISTGIPGKKKHIKRTRSADMSRLSPITPKALDRILSFLAPLFMTGSPGNAGVALAAAKELLDSYGARTNSEIRLAALTIAFSFGALDSLGRSVAADLSVNQLLRLRGNANSLHRAAHKSQEALARLQQSDAEPAQEQAPEDLPESIETQDLVAFARPVQISRQQRRAAERHAEKIRLSQLEEVRRAERTAARVSGQRAA